MDDDALDAALLSVDIDAMIASAESRQNARPDGPAAPPTKAPPPAKAEPRADGGAPEGAPAPAGDALAETLHRHFGYKEFRSGQRGVVEAVLEGKDVAVFWATGSGKSLCYQVPTLHSGRMAVVVSPLISLMKDQVQKLNEVVAGGESRVATFLGSGQLDPHEEERAFRGDYAFLYLSPEKLCASSTIPRLQALHASRPIGLFAVDEAHCVSQWGHDFRPEYSQLRVLRESFGSAVPIMALTATAVPRVREDIISSLRLRSAHLHVSALSFDRKNLVISCRRKPPRGGAAAALQPLIERLRAASAAGRLAAESTIVYVPTQAEADSVAALLRARSGADERCVQCYHGALDMGVRMGAHRDFLTGRCCVMVATVGFGMGIDKPDVRRVVHYGAPKTVENYYQEIGRAGRDGYTAHCDLIASDADFMRYRSDFYVGGLSAEARTAVLRSLDALRAYFSDESACRRRMLLDFFREAPPFDRCGTCDNCRGAASPAPRRDFGAAARVVLCAARETASWPLSATALLDVCYGAYKPRSGTTHSTVERAMRLCGALRAGLGAAAPRRALLKELLPALVAEGYLSRSAKSMGRGGSSFSVAFEVYEATPRALSFLRACEASPAPPPLPLPPPRSVLEAARRAAAARAAALAELESSGVDLGSIPPAEIAAGDGAAIRSQRAWARQLSRLRGAGRGAEAAALEDLLARVLRWRDAAAERLGVAPAAAMSEHLARDVARLRPRAEAALRDLGLRVRGGGALLGVLRAWEEERGLSWEARPGAEAMALPEGAFAPGRPWQFAEYKRRKVAKAEGGGFRPPAWEETYLRFAAGESVEGIAAGGAGPGAKPRAPSTIVGHVLLALEHARPVDLGRLAAGIAPSPLPDRAQWEALEGAAAAAGVDVVAQPGAPNVTDLLAHVEATAGAVRRKREGAASVLEEDRALMGAWYARAKWWVALKRAGVPVAFGAPAPGEGPPPMKRPRPAWMGR